MNNNEIENLKKELSNESELMISPDEVINQINTFEKGIPFIKLVRPCTIGDGIKVIQKKNHKDYIEKFAHALNGGRVIKFVPASGAATRMFKKLLSIIARFEKVDFNELTELARKGDEDCKATLEFFNNLQRFAFYDELRKKTEENGNKLDDFITDKNISELIQLVAESDGLNYANLPKGCIFFHSYPDGARTAFEEHLVEAMNYSAGNDKVAKVHFTISPEHEKEIKKLINSILKKYQTKGWKFDISFSFQSPATDTISVTMDNQPFRDENGKILFRPGGHGALLKNLDDLKVDIISIKNIDNIVPDHLKGETYTYKKILGGYLIELQEKVFSFLNKQKKNLDDVKLIDDTIKFIKDEFESDLLTKLKEKTVREKSKFLFDFLNRPIRVCGMVKNEGHPGGGPFWVESENSEITKQVVETTQIDNSDENQLKILNQATHFSPVDLACGVKDYKGNNFQLNNYSNPATGLIVKKSKDGRELKALELPGLWNGGMYNWLSVFVEVPKITFNPVKEINDLLKPEHQPI
jgi:hypothetical protein